ncbi:MAG: CoA pyrophosphatase [Alphaproteobacteria bacterium]|nr:CoA pyrophosphatase [Alphaproteobacteria bacterium]
MTSDPLALALQRPPTRIDPQGARRAGVALVIDPDDTVLFIRRAVKRGDPWSGHVGLPGGHALPGESFLDAAVRETLEEVGMDLSRAAALGTLDDLRTPSSLPTKVVQPWVFRAPALGPYTLQADEVASVHPFPLHALLAGEGRTTFQLDHGGSKWTLPCVDFDGVRLWGLTLRIVDELLDRLDGRGQGLDRM